MGSQELDRINTLRWFMTIICYRLLIKAIVICFPRDKGRL